MKKHITKIALFSGVLLSACAQRQAVPPAPAATPAMPTPPQASAPVVQSEPDIVTDRRAIMAAQRALNDLGYDVGEPDGIAGPATRRMILAFQKDRNLTQDGRLTTALAALLTKMSAENTRGDTITVAAGDALIYSDGSINVSPASRDIRWDQADGARSVVAIRPNTTTWPAAARAGLDWATTHALDLPPSAAPVQWSSTGVAQEYEIRAFAALTPREATLAGSPSCRRFEMRQRSPARRYPGLACKDAKGIWAIPHSQIRLARPATGLGQQPPR